MARYMHERNGCLKYKLFPSFISGLVDGEGSWSLAINRDPKRTIGYGFLLSFEIALNIKDLHLL